MTGRPELFDLTPTLLPVFIDDYVRWGDMDAFGHLNNVMFFRLFESVRMAYFAQINFADPASNDGLGPILAHTECYFRRPLVYPQTLRVGSRIRGIKSDCFTMDYGVFTGDQEDALAACGSGRVICYDYGQSRRADIPTAVIRRIQEVEGELLTV